MTDIEESIEEALMCYLCKGPLTEEVVSYTSALMTQTFCCSDHLLEWLSLSYFPEYQPCLGEGCFYTRCGDHPGCVLLTQRHRCGGFRPRQ